MPLALLALLLFDPTPVVMKAADEAALVAAMQQGDWPQAHLRALRLVEAGGGGRLLLGALDHLADTQIKAGQLAEAQDTLKRAAPLSGGAPRFRERVARLYRAYAARHAAEGDWGAAAGWLRAAYVIAGLDLDRVALAGALAERAAARLHADDLSSARALLAEAEALDRRHPKVEALRRAGLHGALDPRARLIIVALILGLGVFALKWLRGLFRRRAAWEDHLK
ncbi:hypothetical protein KKB55_04380 [Myxococcota bacterium]|nr:hypothetical protein [Myxococcota bacterium]